MNPLFSILSAAYIAAIYLFADSPMVSDVSPFNPFSLLHIPLYGVLTLFLVLSFSPKRKRFINPTNPINSKNTMNYSVAGIIALVVAIADEIHQAYLPNRDGSIADVFLDIVGIILCMVLFKRIKQISWFSKKIESLRRIT